MREQDIAPWALMLLIILMVIYGFVVDARSHEATQCFFVRSHGEAA